MEGPLARSRHPSVRPTLPLHGGSGCGHFGYKLGGVGPVALSWTASIKMAPMGRLGLGGGISLPT